MGRPRFSGQVDERGARRMLRLKSGGLTYAQIAARFGISPRTVKYHVTKLRREGA